MTFWQQQKLIRKSVQQLLNVAVGKYYLQLCEASFKELLRKTKNF